MAGLGSVHILGMIRNRASLEPFLELTAEGIVNKLPKAKFMLSRLLKPWN